MSQNEPEAESISGVVVATGSKDLLLPSSAVAEVISFRQPAPSEGAPPWLLGSLEWRQRSLPVLSIAAAQEDAEEINPGHRARLVVCFTPSGNSALPYLALFAMAPPRLARFAAEALVSSDEAPRNPLILHALTYGDRPAWIPDMDAIERSLLEALEL